MKIYILTSVIVDDVRHLDADDILDQGEPYLTLERAKEVAEEWTQPTGDKLKWERDPEREYDPELEYDPEYPLKAWEVEHKGVLHRIREFDIE
jgi:hypothetical protein